MSCNPALYRVMLTLHGYLWFHTVAVPTPTSWLHQTSVVIHNYPLILGFLSRLAEDFYAVPVDKPAYSRVRELIVKRRIYVYPAVVKKALIKKVLFSGIGEGHVNIRGRTRLSYPDLAQNTVLLPGSRLETYLLADRGLQLPEFIRIGAKRTGIARAEYREIANYRIEHDMDITHPANKYDTEIREDFPNLVILSHKGGDIVHLAKARRALVAIIEDEARTIVLAYPKILFGGENGYGESNSRG